MDLASLRENYKQLESKLTSIAKNESYYEAYDELLRQQMEDIVKRFLGAICAQLSSAASKPLCFISYAWPLSTTVKGVESDEHVQPFLVRLVEYLKQARIVAQLDLLDLKPGSHINTFMTNGISKSQAVLVIGTPTYYRRAVEKTNVRFEYLKIMESPYAAIILSYRGVCPPEFGDKLANTSSIVDIGTAHAFYFHIPQLLREIFVRTPIGDIGTVQSVQYLQECLAVFNAVTIEAVIASKESLEQRARENQALQHRHVLDLMEKLPLDARMLPEHWHIPLPATPLVERDALVQELADSCQKRSNSRVLLTGEEGIGKKQVALLYAQKFSVRYTFGILLSDCRINALLDELNCMTIEEVIEVFRSQRRWLVILANCRDAGIMESLSTLRNGDIILTTTTTCQMSIEVSFESSVPPLSLAGAVRLLAAHGRFADANWSDVAEAVKCNPRNLVRVATYVRRNLFMNLQTVLEQFDSDPSRFWNTILEWQPERQFAHAKEHSSDSDSPPITRTASGNMRGPSPSSSRSDNAAFSDMDVVCRRLVLQEVDKFVKNFGPPLSEGVDVALAYVWDETSLSLVAFVDQLVAYLRELNIAVYEPLHSRTSSRKAGEFLEERCGTASVVLLIGTPGLQTDQGATLFEYLQDTYTSTTSGSSSSRKLIPLLYDGPIDVFPPEYLQLLIEDVSTSKSFAKALPRIIGQIFGCSGEDKFERLVAEHNERVDVVGRGIMTEVSDKLLALEREQFMQKNKRTELRIRYAVDSLGYTLVPCWWFLPSRTHTFGRVDVMSMLNVHFSSEVEIGAMVQSVIVGLGGVGKSHIALHYASIHRSRYPLAALLNGADLGLLFDSYRSLGEHVGLTLPEEAEKAAQIVKKYLEEPVNAGWLIVVDNGDHPDLIRPHLPSKGGHLLITSRSQDWAANTMIPITTLDRDCSVALLCELSGIVELDGCDALAEQLGDLPLALIQASSYIRENKLTSFGEYSDKLRSLQLRNAMCSPWDVTMDLIKEQDREALHLLRGMACMAPENIPLSFLAKWCAQRWKCESVKEWVFCDRFGKTIDTLVRYSMVTSVNRNAVDIHRLVQAAVKSAMSSERQRACVMNLMQQFQLQFKFDKIDASCWGTAYALLPHIESVLPQFSGECISLHLRVADAYLNQATFGVATDHYQEAFFQAVLMYQNDTLSRKMMVCCLMGLGNAMERLGKYLEQEEYYDIARRLVMQLPGEETMLMADIYTHLGHAARNLAQVEMQREYYSRALELYGSLDVHEDDIAYFQIVCCNGLGHALSKIDFESAKPHFQKAYRLAGHHLGKDSIELAQAMCGLAHIAERAQHYEVAKDYFLRAVNIAEKAYGPEHPNVGDYLFWLGCVHTELKEYDRAIYYFDRVLSIREKAFEELHPKMDEILQRLGNTHELLLHFQVSVAFHTRRLNWQTPILDEFNVRKYHVQLGNARLRAFADMLRFHPTLKDVNLTGQGLGPCLTVALAEALKLNSILERLDVSANDIGAAGSIALAQMLAVNSNLLELSVSWNKIGGDAALELANSLKVNSALQGLNLEYTAIQNEGAVYLFEMLKVNSSLKMLQVSNNELKDLPTGILSSALATNNSLTTLDLRNNKLTCRDGIALADGLKSNVSIQELYLAVNNLQDEGVDPVCDAILVNDRVHTLDIGSTRFQANFDSIENLLLRSKSLRKLSIRANFISSSRMNALALMMSTVTDLQMDNLDLENWDGVVAMLRINKTLIKLKIDFLPAGVGLLVSLLERNMCYLQDLTFLGFEYDDTLPIVLAASLKTNTTLRRLKLHHVLRDSGACALAEMLLDNKTLEVLDLENNEIKRNGATALGHSLLRNTGLQRLKLGNNFGLDSSMFQDLSRVDGVGEPYDFRVVIASNNRQGNANLLDTSSADRLHLNLMCLNHVLASDTAISRLSLHNSQIDVVGVELLLRSCATSPTIRGVEIGSNNLGDEGANVAAKFLAEPSVVDRIYLNFNGITDVGIRTLSSSLAENENITDLSLSGNLFGSDGMYAVENMMSSNHTLRQLRLNYVTMDRSCFSCLTKILMVNSTLTELRLSTCKFGDGGAEAVGKGLAVNTSVRILGLEDNGITAAGAVMLAEGIKRNSTLEKLNLVSNPLFDTGLVALGDALVENRSLVAIDLVNIGPFGQSGALTTGMQAFSDALKVNNKLTCLNLVSNLIRDEGIEAFCNCLSINNSLLQLNFGYNGCCNDCVVRLADAMEQNHAVTLLDLQMQGVGDIGAAAIANMLLINTTLTILDLDGNMIRDTGSVALANALSVNQSVTTLFLEACVLDEAGARAFGAMLGTNKSLTALHMPRCGLNKSLIQSFAAGLKFNKTLKSLTLIRNDMDSNDCITLCQALSGALELEKLALAHNKIDCSGIKALGYIISECFSLRHLELQNNKLDEEASRELAQALLANKSLTFLNISENNAIGDVGMVAITGAIQQHPALLHVELGENECGPSCADALEALLSTNKIVFVGFAHSNDAHLKRINTVMQQRAWRKMTVDNKPHFKIRGFC